MGRMKEGRGGRREAIGRGGEGTNNRGGQRTEDIDTATEGRSPQEFIPSNTRHLSRKVSDINCLIVYCESVPVCSVPT